MITIIVIIIIISSNIINIVAFYGCCYYDNLWLEMVLNILIKLVLCSNGSYTSMYSYTNMSLAH